MKKWIDFAVFFLGLYAVVFVVTFIFNLRKNIDDIAILALLFTGVAFFLLCIFSSGSGSDGDSTGRTPTNM